MKIKIKRIYDVPTPEDGYRVLVDRLWARGISKEKAQLSEWDKDLAPSTELRIWFHQNPQERWTEFSEKYRQELLGKNSGKDFLKRNAKQEIITLLYASKDEKHCHPLILKPFLEKLLIVND